MNNNEQKTRAEIPSDYKWNIEAMYPDEDVFYNDLNESISEAKKLNSKQGSITSSADILFESLQQYFDSLRKIEKAYTYSHMRKDEDANNTKFAEMYNKAVAAYTEFSALSSFLTPEIISAPINIIEGYINNNKGLAQYKFLLHEIMKQKDHTLSEKEEFIIASLSEILGSHDEIFSILNDADLHFGHITKEDGNKSPLTHASYIHYMESKNRDVRKDAYTKMYAKYKEFNNTISAIYSYNVKSDTIIAKLRNYNSSMEKSLSANNIPICVYDNLIDVVNKHLPSMYKYIKIRKNKLCLDNFKMYDAYTPLVKPADLKYTFDEAVDLISKALKPLGDEYISILRKGILEEKWVDIYENKGKRSGAYSFGSYDSYPYILMNFTGDLRDVFTLIHEGGHSMHSYYTRHNQPYIYGDYPIFSAEVASTVNETLLINYLLENCESNELRAYLINFYIDEFKGTLFRQTMFAEFEKITHEEVENGGVLTTDFLNDTYNNLNNKYYGPELAEDDMIQYEWSRIPHFYSSFYVYQYATGYSAANAIANRLLNEGDKARKDYIKFLSSGSSDYPIELLKIAGVDMSTEEPVQQALNIFDKLVDELDTII